VRKGTRMQVRGIIKARNEAHIIGDTLDRWASMCADGVHVYDDHSQDETADICRAHPGVVEVLSSDLFDPNRERAEWYNRQAVFSSAMRFLEPGDWLAYFDADEHLYNFDLGMLQRPEVNVIACRWYDVYITPEDEDLPYTERQWVGPEVRTIPFFYRVDEFLTGFSFPDQRIMHHRPARHNHQSGAIKHFGKGFSRDLWERKVEYYGQVFGPKYAAKWRSRKGKAVHRDYKSDEGRPLIPWDDIVSGRVAA